jgi:hypothetical protein
VRVLFVARHFTYFRNFDSVVRLLAERGHRVHLAAEREESLGGRELVERLAAASPSITVGYIPPRADDRWFSIATVVRRSLDYLAYSARLYDDAPKIRERAWERTPQMAVALSRMPGRPLVSRALHAMDRAIPTDTAIDAFIAEQRPDLVLLTPLIELGSPQLDLLRAAKRRGLRTAVAVWSWDHLTSKARLREQPDRILVWNETQRGEATTLHGLPAEKVLVTGAQCFDQWFGRTPSRSREEYCRQAGLDPSRPYVLYVCGALFRGSPSEAAFVSRWVAQLRGSASAALRDAGILVRPHPQRIYEWDDVRLPEDVAFRGGHPIDQAGRDEYFDAMYHAAAVVGLNTSAMIEAAIVDRPVLTVLLPEFHESQRGTLHFRYLLDGPDAPLHAAADLDAHLRQLDDALAGRLPNRNATFVRRFVRPHGLDSAATPAFVDAVERQMSTAPPAPPRRSLGERVWTPVTRAWYAAVPTPAVQWMMREAAHAQEERDRARRLASKDARVRARDDERQARAAEKDERYRVKRRRQRVTHLKTAVRRMLTGAAGRGAGTH